MGWYSIAGFTTIAGAVRTSVVKADGDLDMKMYRIRNLGRPANFKDATNLEILILFMG